MCYILCYRSSHTRKRSNSYQNHLNFFADFLIRLWASCHRRLPYAKTSITRSFVPLHSHSQAKRQEWIPSSDSHNKLYTLNDFLRQTFFPVSSLTDKWLHRSRTETALNNEIILTLNIWLYMNIGTLHYSQQVKIKATKYNSSCRYYNEVWL